MMVKFAVKEKDSSELRFDEIRVWMQEVLSTSSFTDNKNAQELIDLNNAEGLDWKALCHEKGEDFYNPSLITGGNGIEGLVMHVLQQQETLDENGDSELMAIEFTSHCYGSNQSQNWFYKGNPEALARFLVRVASDNVVNQVSITKAEHVATLEVILAEEQDLPKGFMIQNPRKDSRQFVMNKSMSVGD